MSQIIYVDENGKPIQGLKLLRIRATDTVKDAGMNGRAFLEACLQNRETRLALASILVSGIVEVARISQAIRESRDL